MKHIRILLLANLLPLFVIAQSNNIILADKPVPKPTIVDDAIVKWNESQTNYLTLSKAAKEFFYWVNYSRSNPKRFWDSVVMPIIITFPTLNSTYSLSLKNDLYLHQPLPLFKLNNKLMLTAQSHATDIGTHMGKPGHTSTNGTTFVERISAVGIKNCGGENVSIGNVDPILSIVLLYIDYGIPSVGHRKSLLNPSYLETGLGVSNYGTDGTLFIVQDFACQQ